MEAAMQALTIAAAVGCGLVAGIFFTFSTFVMAALSRIATSQGVAAMQAINVTVLNPWFFVAFFGTAAVCVLLAADALFLGLDTAAICQLAGAALYLIGTILVTLRCNVPRNDALAAIGPDSGEAADLWPRYLSEWTAWNHVRTAASLAAACAFTVALL